MRTIRRWFTSALILIALTGETGFAQKVVISQIYGGGGNAGSTLRNDFIELFNPTSDPIPLSGWCLQYTSSTGSFAIGAQTDLMGSIAPLSYFLVQQAAGAGGTTSLPPPDVSGTIAMGAGAGKVALLNACTSLLGDTESVTGGRVVDFVGYGAGANRFEGTGPTPSPGNTTAVLRSGNGCVDNDDNRVDFSVGPPVPRNSASPAISCNVPPPPPVPTEVTPIFAIQGSGLISPLNGQLVRTRGVVTGVIANGFFIQVPDGMGDGSPLTSDGIFVFTGMAPPSTVTVAVVVEVVGQVVEFRPQADAFSPPLTEIGSVSTIVVDSTGGALPAPVRLSLSDLSPAGPVDQLERFEGMRVSMDSLTVVAPTDGFVNEPSATSTSNGIFYGVLQTTARPFREPGIAVTDGLPVGAPCCIPRFDTNPERIRVDSDGLGGTRLDVNAGDIVMNLSGVLHFGARTYTLLADVTTVPAAVGRADVRPLPEPHPTDLVVASANLERFFDDVNDPRVGEPVLTPVAFQNRLRKVSRAVIDVLRSPDILAVEEVENLPTLQAIADEINRESAARGLSFPRYMGFLSEGNDPGGIDVGFLVKSSRIAVRQVTQLFGQTTYPRPTDGQLELLFDRPPLLLEASFGAFQFSVIVNHVRSLLGVDGDDGLRIREKRRLQAEFVASFVQSRQQRDPGERLILVGDFNAFEFNDGYGDLLGTLTGRPASVATTVASSPDLVNPDLVNLTELVDPADRYSYVQEGSAQVLDHILITRNLVRWFGRIVYSRANADFAEALRSDPERPERLSDHDVPAVYLSLGNQPPVVRAGMSLTLLGPGWAVMSPSITDDGLPTGRIRVSWRQVSGPAAARFIDPNTAEALVRFSAPGQYVLEVLATDGQLFAVDQLVVEVR